MSISGFICYILYKRLENKDSKIKERLIEKKMNEMLAENIKNTKNEINIDIMKKKSL